MSDPADPIFHRWVRALERRHLAELTFAEVRRALQALSSLYVERRRKLERGAALDGAGKRAAFALFYGPLHFLAVRQIVTELGAARPPARRIFDLGCGSGASGAAWALESGGKPELVGIELHPWAVAETSWSWQSLGLGGRTRRCRIEGLRLPGRGAALLLAYTANELAADARRKLLPDLLEAAERGARVLVVEPISRRAVPWWEEWAVRFRDAGGRADRWRFTAELPQTLQRLDRAAGLDHRELTARSLYL